MLEGARWRQEQAAELAITEAWLVANLSRHKKLPKLSTLIRKERTRQTPEQQAAIVRDLAESFGLKVERHDHPVM